MKAIQTKRLLGSLALAVMVLPSAALAGPPAGSPAVCPDGSPAMARKDVRRELERKFGESPMARGLTGEGYLMQLYASETSQTWTLLVTDADGHSCVVGVGVAFETLDPAGSDVRAALPGALTAPTGVVLPAKDAAEP